MSKKTHSGESGPDEIKVSLKPVFGIKPGMYLSAMYLLIIICALFLLLLYPGFRRNGVSVAFTSTPAGASVYLDGVRLGATPLTAFVSSGEHEVRFEKPSFSTRSFTGGFRGRLLASLFFPARQKIDAALTLSDPKGFFASKSREFSSWALAGETTGSYPFPLVLPAAVHAFYASGDEKNTALLYTFIYDMMQNVSSERLLAEWLHAAALTVSEDDASGPLQVLKLLTAGSGLFSRNPAFPFWIASALSPEKRGVFTSTEWYAGFEKAYAERIAETNAERTFSSPAADTISLSGMRFRRIPGGTVISGDISQNEPAGFPIGGRTVPHPVTVGEYYIAETEVTNETFSVFLNETPLWSAGNRDELIRQGLVTEDYLTGWNGAEFPPGRDELPVTNVSYYAAEAFTAWLSVKLSGSLPAFTAALPTEQEWEYAAAVTDSGIGTAVLKTSGVSGPSPVTAGGKRGIRDMIGNVWEWCAGWYFPAADLLPSPLPSDTAVTGNFPGVEKVVKGGSWANEADTVSPAVRGSQPPEWCTPFLGFRPVLRKK